MSRSSVVQSTSSDSSAPAAAGRGVGIMPRTAARHRGASNPLQVVCAAFLALALSGVGCGSDLESRMAEVRALQDVGQFTESIDQLREILAVSPDLPEANYRLGVALVQTGEQSRAVWALQKASESPDYAVVAGLLLANAHFGIKNMEEAIRAADRVLKVDPNSQVALQLRAKALLGIHRLDDALTDAERLVELSPDDLHNRIVLATIQMELGMMEEAEAGHDLVKEMGASSDDPEVAARACLAPALFAKDGLRDKDRTRALYEDCVNQYPTDAFIVSHVMSFLDQIGEAERATEIVRTAVEQAPENLSLRSSLATRLRNQGQTEEAEQVLVEAAETFGSATAWNMLATYHRREKNPEKALEAVEKVMELTGGGGDQLRFTKADLLIDLERYEEAEEVASALDEAIYSTLIQGRIQLARGDPQGALDSFDKGIRHWPNNAGARYLAGLAARELGDFERAITELRESVRADARATDASYVLAKLYYDRGEYQQAVQFAASSALRQQVPNPGNFIIEARAYTALGQYDNARKAIDGLRELGKQDTKVAVELASVAKAESGSEGAVAAMEAAGIDLSDEGNEPALRAMSEHLAALGRIDEAIARIDLGLARSPESASLYALRGNMLVRAGRADEAREAFDRAKGFDAENAEAIGGLATLAANAGDMADAVKLFDRASELDPYTPSYAYAAAQLTLGQGLGDDAEKRLRDVVRRFPGQAAARNDLAWILSEKGEDLDLALELAEEASRLDPTPPVLDTLGWVQLKRGDAASAVETFERALEQDAASASIRFRLGIALGQAGEVDRAREQLQQALATGSFPEADEARKQLALLDKP